MVAPPLLVSIFLDILRSRALLFLCRVDINPSPGRVSLSSPLFVCVCVNLCGHTEVEQRWADCSQRPVSKPVVSVGLAVWTGGKLVQIVVVAELK